MRILGLDVGTKTIGIAISDELGWTAQGMETIRFRENQLDSTLPQIKKYIEENSIGSIVVGLPKNMNGSIGERGQACQAFGEMLKEAFQIPVIFWDERLTTMAAQRLLIEADVSRKKRKQVVDKMAAVLILQGYLDFKS